MKKIALTLFAASAASLLCAAEPLLKTENLKDLRRTSSLTETAPGVIYSKRITSAEMVKKTSVVPEKAYRISCELRAMDDAVLNQKIRIGVFAYTEDEKPAHISGIMPFAGTETELAKAVTAKDKVVKVKDCSAWKKSSSRIVFNVDASGQLQDIPNFNFLGASVKSFAKEGDIYAVTLSRPAGIELPAGTKIRQHADSRPAIFSNAKPISKDWKKYEFIIGPGVITKNNATNKLYSGVKKVAPMCYMAAKCEMRNLMIEVVE